MYFYVLIGAKKYLVTAVFFGQTLLLLG